MDVLWFRLPKPDEEGGELFAVVGAGEAMVLIDRVDYFQTAFIVPKDSDTQIREQPIEDFRERLVRLTPELANAVGAVTSWDEVQTLRVKVDRLTQWSLPGLLLIGDAAHAMSPIGGVGINLAIQDSIAAANILGPTLATSDEITDSLLAQVQEKRLPAVKRTQSLQIGAQNNVLSPVLASKGKPPSMPLFMRWLLKFRHIRNIPARIIGYGFDREDVSNVQTGD